MTLEARVRLLSCVGSLVHYEVWLPPKSLPTLWALVGSLTRVGPLVFDES